MNDQEDHAAVKFPPPVVGILTIIIGYVLGRYVPIMDDFLLPSPARYWVGGIVAVTAGIGLGWWPVRLFNQIEQDARPWTPTPEIVVEGPYKFSRNPMYLMMLIVCFGFSIILDEAWVLVLTPVCAVVIYLTAIRHEEAYLERKFGDSYRNYKESVRRWI
jgi:protein-S-isoprenylcysteine O-methyltransferase Ste14